MDHDVPPLGEGDPDRLGPYRLSGVLGAGGMGRVYLGRDDSGRPAAVKVLLPGTVHDEHMVQRFHREAGAAAAVRGPGVGGFLGSGTTPEGLVWLAGEFLVGPSLDAAIRRHGPLDVDGVRALGAALVTGLRTIHRAGLVHRDLKPANIVLTADGPRVIDFGLTRPEYGLTLTRTGQIPATPGYAPPEQVTGERTGPPGDVFSLGVVLAHAAGGRGVFTGGHPAAVQYAVVHGEPDLSAVPAELRETVRRCLAKDPGARPALSTLRRELATPRGVVPPWRTGPIAEDIEGRRMATGRWTERPAGPARRRVLGVAGVLAPVVLGAGTGAWWWRSGAATADEPWRAEPLPDHPPGGNPAPYWTLPDVAPAEDAVPAPVVARDIVVVASAEGGVTGHRVDGDGERVWHEPEADPAAGVLAAVSGGTASVCVRAADGRLVVLDAADGSRIRTVGAGAVALLAVTDGAAHLVTADDRIAAVDLGTGETRWTVPAPEDLPARPPAAVGAGRLLLPGASELHALDTTTGRTVWRLDTGPPPEGEPIVPAVAGNVGYLGGAALIAFDLADGASRWSRAPGTGVTWGSATVTDDLLHVRHGTDLTCRDARDGGDVWTLALGFDPGVPDPPVVQHRTVWAVTGADGGDGVAAAGREDGIGLWSISRAGGGRWRAAGADNRAFLLHSGTLMAMPVV